MKHVVLFSVLSLIFLANATRSEAFVMPQQSDPATQLLLQTLVECGKQKLGGENSIDLAYAMGEQANRQIVSYCKSGNKKKAYDTAVFYSKTDQGKAALECAAQLKPLVEQPSVQQILGMYGSMVNDVMNGVIPQDVCVGIQQVYR